MTAPGCASAAEKSADAQALGFDFSLFRSCGSRDASPLPRCVPPDADRPQLTPEDLNLDGEAANLALEVIHGPLCLLSLGSGLRELRLPALNFLAAREFVIARPCPLNGLKPNICGVHGTNPAVALHAQFVALHLQLFDGSELFPALRREFVELSPCLAQLRFAAPLHQLPHLSVKFNHPGCDLGKLGE